MPQAAEPQPVETTSTSRLISSVAMKRCDSVALTRGLSQPARPTTPRTRPAAIASLSGLNEPRHLPPCMYSMYSCEKPAIIEYFCVTCSPLVVRFG